MTHRLYNILICVYEDTISLLIIEVIITSSIDEEIPTMALEKIIFAAPLQSHAHQVCEAFARPPQ